MNTLNIDGKTYQLTEIPNSAIPLVGVGGIPCRLAPEPPKKPKTIWDLEVGDEYWFCGDDDCYYDSWAGTTVDTNRRNSGNFFLTKPEAEKELKKRQAIQKIRKYIHDEGMEWEWKIDDNNYSISWDADDEEFDSDSWTKFKMYSPIGYLVLRQHAQKIIDNFPDELKLIFDV